MNQVVWYTRNRWIKALYKIQKKLRRGILEKIENIYYRYNVSRSHSALNAKLGTVSAQYDKYLREQLEETLLKRRLFGRLSFDVIPLIDMLASKYSFTQQAVLCVGCRNDDEIRYFRKRGADKVVGIDLYNAGPDILIMDMHDLKFPDSSFDVVYSRHSFEHAFDKRKAGLEFVRVLKPGGVVVIEVPGKYKGGGDYNYFDSNKDVLIAFDSHIEEILWDEYSRKEDNTDKMDIIRVMFRIKK
jgi:SAM-dependent methyltransferase